MNGLSFSIPSRQLITVDATIHSYNDNDLTLSRQIPML